MGNTAATEMGDVRGFKVCECGLCKPEGERRKALGKLEVLTETWSNALVDSENSYTTAGDDPLFDLLHIALNKMRGEIIDEWNREGEQV